MRYFASAQPGFGPLLAEEVAGAGAVPEKTASDGRNDLVAFESRGAPPELRTAEDVFAEVARVPSGRLLSDLTDALVDAAGLERALSAFGIAVRPLRARETYRVIARVASERNFLRTQLRDALHERLARVRPRWRTGDPADMELWALETSDWWTCGLRLTRRSRRTEERHGALRPSVAAAMVRLAGDGGRLLDPFCGSGTILAAAREAGWSAYGADIDHSALDVARANASALLFVADACSPPLRDGTFDAIVSNLPFGKQFAIESVERSLFGLRALITPNGRTVVLTAHDATIPPVYATDRRMDVEVLGQPATLWVLRVEATRRPGREP